jgi:hypothetical protein
MAEIPTLSPMRVARQVVGMTALLLALVPTASARAQTGDPAAGTPSGVIYEIPLDNARLDAAPVRRKSGSGQGSARDRAEGGTVSPIRSENGFGSSSTVPGAATLVSAAKSGANKGSGRGGASGSGGGSAGAQGSGSAGASTETIRGAGTASITPSKSRAYLLLLLAVLVAAGLGLAGRYVARRR